jgi:hypothetical protein
MLFIRSELNVMLMTKALTDERQNARLTEGQNLACKWQAAMQNLGDHDQLAGELYKVRNPMDDRIVDPKRNAGLISLLTTFSSCAKLKKTCPAPLPITTYRVCSSALP